MRIGYFGTASFAVPALSKLAPHLVIAVSQPDRQTGRGLQVQPSPVKAAALELGLPVLTPEKARDPEFVAQIQSLQLDFLMVAAYGQILSTFLLGAARHGGINLHGSILPAYRGAAPIQRCLQDGLQETGVTMIQMEKGMDTGPIIAIETLAIDPDETYGELQDRLAVLAAEMAGAWAHRLASGDYPQIIQEHEIATYAPKIEKAEAELQWTGTCDREYNRYRAFTPSPGAFLMSTAGLVKLSKVRRAEVRGEPGKILALTPNLVVALGDGALELLEVQPAGKKRMSGKDWAVGMRWKPGDRIAATGTSK